MGNRRKPSKNNMKVRQNLLRDATTFMRSGKGKDVWQRDQLVDFGRLMDVLENMEPLWGEVADLVWSDPKNQTQEVHEKLCRFEMAHIYMIEVLNAIMAFIDQPGVGSPWTEAETEKAVMMKANGVSLEDIALRLDRTVQAVANRITMAVGIKQTMVRLNGYLEGRLEGELAEGHFQGVMHR